MKTGPLAKICKITMGQAPPGNSYNEIGDGLPLIAGAGDFGAIYPNPKKFTTTPNKITKEGDLILCIRATIGDLNWSDKNYCLGRGVAGLRTFKDTLDKNYLWHWISANKHQLLRMANGSTFKQISYSDIASIEIPLPSLNDQERIAAILDKADLIRRKRYQTIQLADDFLQSVFLDMFGDPLINPKKLPSKLLCDVVDFRSGGTPDRKNKEFWKGTFPWVSPKDMKFPIITQSEEKIHEDVFLKTPLKKIPENTILIVVRGMILSHTVPIAIAAREVAINQDMKGLIPKGSILPEFLHWCLMVQHNYILSKVSTAAHGTKRLDMENLRSINILTPSIEKQLKFVSIVRKFNSMKERVKLSIENCEMLFNSLTQRAFNGEL